MLLTKAVLDGIVDGRINLVFRRWQKPTVKSGGTLRTAVGILTIHTVDLIGDPQTEPRVTDDDAIRAGYCDAKELLVDLFKERPNSARGAKGDGPRSLYRILVSYAGVDPRISLRADDLFTDQSLATLLSQLAAIDARSTSGQWTQRVLTLIDSWPGRRAPELAEIEGRETLAFKNNVRKLKTLGLTESLSVGYRLSPRGERVLTALQTRR